MNNAELLKQFEQDVNEFNIAEAIKNAYFEGFDDGESNCMREDRKDLGVHVAWHCSDMKAKLDNMKTKLEALTSMTQEKM